MYLRLCLGCYGSAVDSVGCGLGSARLRMELWLGLSGEYGGGWVGSVVVGVPGGVVVRSGGYAVKIA
ncbi:hypothetical protein Tco_1447515 [Tanacetum coccineum]